MAKAETTRIFGTKFHRAFPRVFRSCNDSCGCGVYPTTTGDNYEYGIDLLTAADDQTVSSYYEQSLIKNTIFFASDCLSFCRSGHYSGQNNSATSDRFYSD